MNYLPADPSLGQSQAYGDMTASQIVRARMDGTLAAPTSGPMGLNAYREPVTDVANAGLYPGYTPPASGGNMPPPLPNLGSGTTTPPATTPPATTPPATTPATTPESAYNAMTSFADSAGMKFAMEQAMKALNEQYAAHGQLQSGAAAKGISDYAQNMALQNYFFPYMNYLSGQQAMGAGAASSIAGVGQNFGNTAAGMGQNYSNAVTGINAGMGGAINSGAQNIGNLQLANGQNQANLYGSIGSALGGLGSSIFNSSVPSAQSPITVWNTGV